MVSNNLFLLVCALLFSMLVSPLICITMVDASSSSSSSSSTKDYVITAVNPGGEDPLAYYIQILSIVLGSKKAAKIALLRYDRYDETRFAARLTPMQVAKISKQWGVISVVRRKTACPQVMPPPPGCH